MAKFVSLTNLSRFWTDVKAYIVALKYVQSSDSTITNVVALTKAQYDALGTKVATTAYITTDESESNIFDLIYPVGSIYMSVVNTNPSLLFGGTWSAWGSGKVPVGVDTADTDFDVVEETGGSKTAIQAHTHSTPAHAHTTSSDSHNHTFSSGVAASAGDHDHNLQYGTGSSTLTLPIRQVNVASTWGDYIDTAGAHTHTVTGTISSDSHTHTIADSGGGTSGSAGTTGSTNLPPYITCYMWKRTA